MVPIQVCRGVAPVVGEHPFPALNGQGHRADPETLQQLGRQVAGAVVGDADRSVHGDRPPILSDCRGSIPEKPQRKLKKASIFESGCDKIQKKRWRDGHVPYSGS